MSHPGSLHSESQTHSTPLRTYSQLSSLRKVVDISFPAPSMFGRDLVEQVRADARGSDRQVPVIVEKCIDAIETLGMYSPMQPAG